jgi:hypothetical protein
VPFSHGTHCSSAGTLPFLRYIQGHETSLYRCTFKVRLDSTVQLLPFTKTAGMVPGHRSLASAAETGESPNMRVQSKPAHKNETHRSAYPERCACTRLFNEKMAHSRTKCHQAAKHDAPIGHFSQMSEFGSMMYSVPAAHGLHCCRSGVPISSSVCSSVPGGHPVSWK